LTRALELMSRMTEEERNELRGLCSSGSLSIELAGGERASDPGGANGRFNPLYQAGRGRFSWR